MKAELDIAGLKAKLEVESKELDGFIKAIVPDPIVQLGGILTDHVVFWRWKNQVKIAKKAKKFLDDNGITPQQIPLKIFIPLLEQGALEEDDNIQTKWASLLANAASGNRKVLPNYIEILSGLSAVEVSILDTLHKAILGNTDKKQQMVFSREKIGTSFGLNDEDTRLIVENLIRLGICRPPLSQGISFGGMPIALQTTDAFEVTYFGLAFIEACRYS